MVADHKAAAFPAFGCALGLLCFQLEPPNTDDLYAADMLLCGRFFSLPRRCMKFCTAFKRVSVLLGLLQARVLTPMLPQRFFFFLCFFFFS